MPSDVHWQPLGFGSGVVQDDMFFYVPHCPLGHVLLWDLPDPAIDRPAYELALRNELDRLRTSDGFEHTPTDEFDPLTCQPHGQTGTHEINGTWANFQDYWWLAIYPDPRGRRLIPALYQPGEEGGAYLMPLDLQALAMLRHAVWVTPTEAIPVTQRLRQLLSDPSNPILTAFRRTATWLTHNPILQSAEQQRRELDTLAAAVTRWD